jgi:hypothetical protein
MFRANGGSIQSEPTRQNPRLRLENRTFPALIGMKTAEHSAFREKFIRDGKTLNAGFSRLLNSSMFLQTLMKPIRKSAWRWSNHENPAAESRSTRFYGNAVPDFDFTNAMSALSRNPSALMSSRESFSPK